MPIPNRIQKLLGQTAVTGIDYVFVHGNQVTLDVHFHRDPTELDSPLHIDLALGQLSIKSIFGEGDTPDVPIIGIGWLPGNRVLQLTTKFPGDFTLYRLHIDDNRIDLYFNNVKFSFKANCPSDLDCEPPAHECPPEQEVDFPVNYLARDFWSFRRALLDFASQRYPDWKDRLEADAGVMLAEVMSALGDEFAYYQDRVAREGYFETATQRRSLRRHLRLVDYHIHNGLSAGAWLDFTVSAVGVIPAGFDVWASGDNGQRIDFEVGNGLVDVFDVNGLENPKAFDVHPNRNEYDPHIWDEDDTCLPVGSTEIFIIGNHAPPQPPSPLANSPQFIQFDDKPDNGQPGKWMVLKTNPGPSLPEQVHLVRVIKVTNGHDAVFSESYTHLVWEKEQALPFEMDMRFLKVRGNIVAAAAGRTFKAQFVVGEDPSALPLLPVLQNQVVRAVERQGRDGSVAYLFSLPQSDTNTLAWVGKDATRSRPEVHLGEAQPVGLEWKPISKGDWEYKRDFLGEHSSQNVDKHFSLDDGTWRRVVGYQRIGTDIIHEDYSTNDGFTIRFGDGEFGRTPAEKTVFQVAYRLGGGKQGNVAAGSITHFDTSLPFVTAVVNPLSASNGINPESPAEARQVATEAFRAVTFRAVRSEDYAAAAETLPWVQRAGAAFRWTGSWLSSFVTPDPIEASTLSLTQEVELIQLLDRYRQAGREAHVLKPVYADIDLEIVVCVAPSAYLGEVKERVLLALFGKKGVRPQQGYFSPDRFTFGTPLDRSILEAAIQSVEGVKAVEGICFRRSGFFDWRAFKELSYPPGMDTIIRVDNDPLYPERGSVRLLMEGGAGGLKLRPESKKCKPF